MKAEIVSTEELAQALSLTARRVRDLVRAGVIPKPAKADHHEFIPALQAYVQHLQAQVEKPAAGQPTAYRPEFCDQARVLAKFGATDAELAQAFEVDRRTIFNWRTAHPEFEEACLVGKEAADDRVERSLYELAVGWNDQPPHAGAAFGWLYNRRGDKWKRRQEITGKDGAPLIPVTSTMPLAEAVAAYAQIVAAEEGDMPADESGEPGHVPEIPDQS